MRLQPEYRRCCDCEQLKPEWCYSFVKKRCDDCHRVIRRRNNYKSYWRKRSNKPRVRPPRIPWTTEEHERLIHACRNGFTLEEGVAYVGTGRSAEACRSRACNYFLPPLRIAVRTNWGRGAVKWTPERVAELRPVLEALGPARAARFLGLSVGTIAGIMHRHIRHSRKG